MSETLPPDGGTDPIGYARWRGVQDAKSGPGFTPPWPVGDARRRAWMEGYNGTPKGVPQTSGPKGRSEDEFMAGAGAGESADAVGTPTQPPTFIPSCDPYTNLLAAAKRQGRAAGASGTGSGTSA